jgi:hypothetical protein
MQSFNTNLPEIRKISWLLATASANNYLDIPGEYIWAFPKTARFEDVRARYRSIFSSGNSIKDPEVIEHIQNVNISPFLLDPWTVNRFEDNFVSWIQNSQNFKLSNLNLFTYTGFSSGTQESFLNYYLINKDRRLRVFKGDYWWHMDIWQKTNIQWKYIEDDDIRPGDACICSYPFALTGDKHQHFDLLVDECNKKNVNLLIDFIYLPNSINCVNVDLSAPCINEITFSFSKTFPVQCAKIAVRMLKEKPNDPMQMSNDENICNRLSAGLANNIIEKFPVDFIANKYKTKQEYWCKKLGLKQTKVVHFGLGDDYTDFGRDSLSAWCSPFNQQQNRYNLGMLYENENLLKNAGFITGELGCDFYQEPETK